MPRYFLEVAYHGANYSGFQVQENAHTVQQEIENAMTTVLKQKPELTGSSRTDSGVHARQNFFHFDLDGPLDPRIIYNLNALLPGDVCIRSLQLVRPESHCRFDALTRTYCYSVYNKKDPFLRDRAYYYPYTLHKEQMVEAAALILAHEDFTSFSKRNTQVHTYNCNIIRSEWMMKEGRLEYHVEANRFLRGMVRGLVATMLRVGRGRASVDDVIAILAARDNSKAWFDVPGHGLVLEEVKYDWGKILEPAIS